MKGQYQTACIFALCYKNFYLLRTVIPFLFEFKFQPQNTERSLFENS